MLAALRGEAEVGPTGLHLHAAMVARGQVEAGSLRRRGPPLTLGCSCAQEGLVLEPTHPRKHITLTQTNIVHPNTHRYEHTTSHNIHICSACV